MEGLLILTSLLATLLLLIISYYSWKKITRMRKKIINQVLNSWPIFGMLPSILMNQNRLPEWITEQLLSIKGGTTVLSIVGTKFLITSEEKNIEYVVRTKFNKYIKSGYLREILSDFLGDAVLLMEAERFLPIANVVSNVFASNSFKSHASKSIQKAINLCLLPQFHKGYESGKKTNLQECISLYTSFTIAEAGIGVDPTKIEGSSCGLESFSHAFDTAMDVSIGRVMYPTMLWKAMRFLRWGPEGCLLRSRTLVWNWIEKAMVFRKNELRHSLEDLRNGKPMDLLSAAALQASSVSGLPTMEDLGVTIIMAGKDTVGTALTWFFWALGQHPHVEEKVIEELDRIVNKRPSQRSKAEEFSLEEIKEMTYLHAALSESLRLYPSVPFEMIEAAQDDVLPNGTRVRKGDIVVYSIYSSGRSKELWGEEANEFNPERWLHEERFVQRSEYKFLAFNAGPRRCLGKEFAYWVMKWAVAAVLIRYKVCVVPEQAIVPKLSMTASLKHGLQVYVKKR